jgi:putative mycofactocin binding protein MftB
MATTPTSPPPTATAPAAFDPAAHWRIHPGVSVRPEPFGALLYHFGTRRLTFLKDRRLLDVVTALGDRPSALAACEAAGVPAHDVPRYTAALARLARIDMIVRLAGSSEEVA